MVISCVVPVFNAAPFLRDCYLSLSNQTFKPSEIIFVDNNSTDDSWRILNEIANSDNSVIILKEVKQGASAARNKGLSIAKGNYIQFLDADDLLDVDKLSHQVNLILKDSASPDLVIANFKRVYLKNKFHEEVFFNEIDFWLGLLESRLGCTCSNLWKKEKLLEVGGWNENLMSSQEYDLMFRLLAAKANLRFDSSFKTTIRLRAEGNISSVNIKNNLINYCELRLRVVSFLKKNRLFKDAYNQILFDCIRPIFNYNRSLAKKLVTAHLPRGYKPKVSSSTTLTYVFFYRIFGFYFTESIRSMWLDKKKFSLSNLKFSFS